MLNPSVLIVGAGPTGLIHALTLLRNGIPVRIIEKQESFQLGTRGCGIQPRTIEMYKLLGTLPDLLKVKTGPFPVMKFSSPEGDEEKGQLLPMVETLENTPSRPFNTGFMLMQERQEHLLRSRLEKDYGVTVELSTELRSFEEHGDHVIAHIVKHAPSTEEPKEETIKVEFLVGADGGRSTVRKQLGIDFLGDDSASLKEIGMVVGDIEALEGTLDQKIWRMWGDTTSNMLSLRPCNIPDKTHLNFFVGGIDVDLEKVASSRDELVNAINAITGRTDIKFGKVLNIGIWRPNIRMVSEFGKGRVFIAGDAAHVHSPTGGQGMNSGVQDAINLGWKLALVSKNLAPSSILTSYTAERVPVIATMLSKTTELFQKTFQPASAEKMAQGWRRGYELRMFGVNYRKSGITLDEKYTYGQEEVVDPYRSGDDGTVRAGDRAPDAPKLSPVGQTNATTNTTFLDIFNPAYHTLLVFADPNQHNKLIEKILETAQGLPSSKDIIKTVVVLPQTSLSTNDPAIPSADMVLLDTEGYAYKHYDVAANSQQPTVFIVRPDGFIGGLVFGAEGIKKYFGLILKL
ncbi:FAD binding domain-containing protein [Lentinula aciculospora]|uniref:FAD binding domain-containing protein n=1 Tax=Lentinula aciculospora TaxID=153920 RepID=A0A9W9A6T6_9AGAR|nr:FAD binding domain-containing protein [Lentinula aciculospora]